MAREPEMNWWLTMKVFGAVLSFIIACAAVGLLLVMFLPRPSWALTHYAGEWDGVDPKVRSWFQSLRSPHGVPCCNMADGHKTLEDWRGQNEYWIPDPTATDGLTWIQVPPEAVVYNAGNPTGEAVVWYVMQGPNQVFIRCFVPGGGV
jgi:hypothetical protein